MQINWTVVTYIIIGLFALGGIFRGWWKEGITTMLLVILVFLLQQPGVADAFIQFINSIIALVWSIAPDFFNSLFQTLFGVSTTTGAAVQANPADGSTWLVILVFGVVLTILLSRFLTPAGNVTLVGSILGGLVGAFNGFIVANLVREYMDGRSLPGSELPTSEIALAGSSGTVGVASPGLSLQAVELPRFTILDSLLPWIVIAIGLIILIAVVRTGFGFRGVGVSRRTPPGYR